jgi:hypothetical protein
MNKTNTLLNDTLRVRLSTSLKDKLIKESSNLNIDLSDLVRQRLERVSNYHEHHNCYDCKTIKLPYYQLKDPIWLEAFPEYKEVKNKSVNIPIELCFNCLQSRLERDLTINDFDLTLPINFGIGLGYGIGVVDINIFNELQKYLKGKK